MFYSCYISARPLRSRKLHSFLNLKPHGCYSTFKGDRFPSLHRATGHRPPRSFGTSSRSLTCLNGVSFSVNPFEISYIYICTPEPEHLLKPIPTIRPNGPKLSQTTARMFAAFCKSIGDSLPLCTKGIHDGLASSSSMSTHEPNITSCLPTELLSKIFHHMLDPFDAVEKHIYPERNALELLRVSHVSSYFREVAVNDPSLWAKAPYVNDVHEDFLPVILRRSEPCAIELSFGDYKGLSEDAQTKEQLVQHFSRVSKLQVQIGVPYENSTLKSLFSLPAPSLTDCTLLFLVHSNTSLDSFDRDVLRPFNERAPLLQHLHLINCTIPPEYYDTFPKLSSLSMMQYIGDGLLEDHIPFMPIDDIFKLGKGLSSLHTLTLIKCVQRGGVEFDLDVSQGPVYLPSLRHFHLETSVEGCQQLAKVLKVPATCARELTIIFPGHYRFGLEAANAAAEAVSLFISLNVRYRECSITVVRTAPSLRLVAICGSISTLRFEVSELNVDLPDPAQHLGGGARPSFLRTATGILTPKDIFLHQVWLTLSTSLRRPLSTVLVLNLWVGDGSPAPCLLVELLKSMRCLKELACRTSNLWAHPYIHILLEHDTTPALTKVKIPLDDDVVRPEVLLALNQFLRSRREVREVTFRVPTSTLASMGYAAPDAVRCLIRSVSEHFPDTVALDWVRFQ